jgi:hypothetical protein
MAQIDAFEERCLAGVEVAGARGSLAISFRLLRLAFFFFATGFARGAFRLVQAGGTRGDEHCWLNRTRSNGSLNTLACARPAPAEHSASRKPAARAPMSAAS